MQTASIRALVTLGAVLLAFSAPKAAFAQWHAAAESELSKRTKKLGVLVATGYRAHVVKRGTLMNIGKLGQFVGHDDPKVADAVFEAAAAQLRLEERYEIQRLAIDPEAARAISAKMSEDVVYPKELKKLLEPYYASCQCDALLLIADGRAENMFSETAPSFGPSFSAKAAVSNTGEATKSHLRLGLVFALHDPVEKESVRSTLLSDVPDYSPDVQKYWPQPEGSVPAVYWERMAAYVGALPVLYQRALFRIGLRPSCALPYFDKDAMAQRRGTPPPQVLPGSDPAKCQPAP